MRIRTRGFVLAALLVLAVGCSSRSTGDAAKSALASLAAQGGGKMVFVEFYSPT